jgi:chemotaxis protein histidine kinase CheA
VSDESITTAKDEINDEIANMENILHFCKNNDDVYQNANNFQKHTHKIKGLAPIIGKEELGVLSSMLDNILNEMIQGKKNGGIFDILTESLRHMRNSMCESNSNMSQINNKINT